MRFVSHMTPEVATRVSAVIESSFRPLSKGSVVNVFGMGMPKGFVSSGEVVEANEAIHVKFFNAWVGKDVVMSFSKTTKKAFECCGWPQSIVIQSIFEFVGGAS